MDSSGDSSSPSAMKISSSPTDGYGSNNSTGVGNDAGDPTTSGNSNSNSNNDSYISSIALPPAFVEDPAGFLTSIASRPGPSLDAISLLAGPLSKWFLYAEESHRDATGNGAPGDDDDEEPNPPPDVHPAVHVAQLYLRAAATQLREEQQQQQQQQDRPQVMGGVTGSVAAAAMAMESTSIAHGHGIAESAANALSREQLESKNRVERHREETLEAAAAAAGLCSDRTAIKSSGILPVLANLVAKTTSTSTTNSVGRPGASGSVIASSLPNLSSSSCNAFPPLTMAHTAFLQCAVLAEEHDFAETVVRGTWPLPTSFLRKKKGVGDDSDDAAISIILRYYYLRGVIHYGCGGRDHYHLAHRCWWTCLSIGDLGNDTAMKAWKKLTLVQPLLDIDSSNRDGGRSKSDVNEMNIDGNASGSNPGPLSAGKHDTKSQQSTRLPKCARTLLDTKSLRGKLVEKQGKEKDFYSVYMQLGPAVEAVNRPYVETLLVQHESVLVTDGNTGMARNCLRRVKELQVRTASKIFSVTSIRILARRWNVTLEEARQQLSDAVASGVVPCRVEEDGTVVFSSQADSGGPTEKNTGPNWADLTVWMKLLERLQLMDVNLAISSKYNAAAKHKDNDKRVTGGGDAIRSAGPRGVEEFYANPTI